MAFGVACAKKKPTPAVGARGRVRVELQGVEPWSSQADPQLSTCLFALWLSGWSRPATRRIHPYQRMNFALGPLKARCYFTGACHASWNLRQWTPGGWSVTEL